MDLFSKRSHILGSALTCPCQRGEGGMRRDERVRERERERKRKRKRQRERERERERVN